MVHKIMKFLGVLFTMARAYLYYPVFIGLFLWLYVQQAHWSLGLIVILAMLYLDPIWRIMGNAAWRKLRKNSK